MMTDLSATRSAKQPKVLTRLIPKLPPGSITGALPVTMKLPEVPFDDEHLGMQSMEGLLCVPGQFSQNLVRAIHGMRVCDITGQVLYLCTWEQDLVSHYYTPSWVLAPMLTTERGYKAIANFFSHFASDTQLN